MLLRLRLADARFRWTDTLRPLLKVLATMGDYDLRATMNIKPRQVDER